MSFLDKIKTSLFITLVGMVLLLSRAGTAYADNNLSISGDFSAIGQTIQFNATAPQSGGAISGSFSGFCNGSISGNYDSSSKIVNGTVNGTCTLVGVNKNGNFNFQAAVDTTNNKLTVTKVTRTDGSNPGALQYAPLPVTTDIQVTGNNNNSNTNSTQNSSPSVISNLSVGQSYTLSNGAKINFSSLPSGSNSISFTQLNLSQDQANSLGAASLTAYQITSNMSNGSFTYDLSLPIPSGVNPYSLKVKYAPDVSSLTNASDITAGITINSDGTFTIHGLNHFTVFVVTTNPSDPACVGAGGNCYSTIQAAIDAASSGDTINIQSGTYNQTVYINKNLTLNGVNTGSGYPSVTKLILWAPSITITNVLGPITNGSPTASITNPVNNSNKSNVSITGTGLANANLSWSISDGTHAPITGTGVVSAGGSFSITGVNVSSLNDGSLTLTLTLNDGAGHTSTSATASSFKNTVPPAKPVVTLTNPINLGNRTNVSLSGTGQAGTTAQWSISDGVNPSVTGTTTVNGSGSLSVTGINVSSLNDGGITLSVQLTDSAGNVSLAGVYNSTKDTTPPVVSAGANQVKNSAFTQTATASDADTGINTSSYSWSQVSGPGTITFGSPNGISTTISASADGTYVVSFSASDNGGNSSTSTFSLTWDTTPPLVSAGANVTTNAIFTKTGTVTDPAPSSGIASTTWSMVSGPGTITFGSASSLTTTISASADGTYVIKLTATDNAGNSASSTFTLVWDTVAPVVSAGSNKTTNAIFTQVGTANDPAPSSGINTIAWSQVSGPGTAAFGSPNALTTSISANTDGTYVLKLTVTDNAGNVGSSTFSLVWDTVAPVVNSGSNQVKNAIFTQVGTVTDPAPSSGIASTTWSQVSGPGTITFGSANSTTTTILASVDGSYVIKLTAVDNAGNSNSSTFTLTWDTVPPVVNAGSNKTTNAIFTQVGTVTDPAPSSGIASISWSMVSGPGVITFGTPSSSTTTLSASVDGTYVIKLSSTDNAGNTGSSTFSLVWDTVAPVVNVGGNIVTNAVFTKVGTVTDPAPSSGIATTVWSQVSGPGTITFGSSTSTTTTISANADGTYIIKLTATDNAGNSSSASFSLVWDTVPPVVSAGGNVVARTIFTQVGTVTDPAPSSGIASTTWSMVSGPGTITFGSINATTTTVSASLDGTYVIKLTAVDNAGNSTSSTFNLTWDTTPPVVSAGGNKTTNAIFTQVGTVTDPAPSSGIASILWSTVSGPGTITYGSVSLATTTISASADGTYVIKLTATDNAGNVGSSTFSLVWDTVAPIVGAGPNVTTNAAFTQTGTAVDPAPSSGIASYLWSKVSGPGTITFGTPNALTTTVSAGADGTYIIKLTVTDNAGNSAFNQFTLVWDTQPPVVSAGANQSKNATFTQVGTATDPAPSSGIAVITWSQVSGPGTITFGSASSLTTTITASVDGAYVIKLSVSDSAGNTGTSTFTLNWDTVPPTVNVGGNVTTNTSFSKTAIVTDPAPSSGIASTVWSQVSGPGTITFGSINATTTTVSASLDGTYVIKLTATDNAGNSNSSTFTLVWDTTPPVVSAGVNQVKNSSFTQTGTVNDPAPSSGIASVVWSQVSGPGIITFGSPNSAITTVSASADGTYTIKLTATDNAGNSASSTFTLVWDTVPPNVSVGANIVTNAVFTKVGTVTDPAPSSGIASTTWSQVSGPGTITFGSANSTTTTILASVDGSYVIKLTAVDNAGNSNSSTFTLTWDTVPPVVSAGPTVTTHGPFIPASTASDPAPASGIASYLWSVAVAGPGSVAFSNPNALITSIQVSQDGTYTIKLTVTDNAGNQSSATFVLNWTTATSSAPLAPPSLPSPPAPDAKPGSAPSLVSAQSSGPGQITLTWNKANDPVTNYQLEFGTGPDSYQYGAPSIGNVTSYTVSFLQDGVKYYFRIKAVNGNMPGDQSNELSAYSGFGAQAVFAPLTQAVKQALGPTTAYAQGPITQTQPSVQTNLGPNAGTPNLPVLVHSPTPLPQVTSKPSSASTKSALAAFVTLVLGSVAFFFSRIRF